jgi:hypothetical protein
MSWKIAVAGLGLLALAGCAVPAPYAPRQPGQSTGYTDRQIAANRYRITFAGNSVTPRPLVEDDLLLRAAEVTLAAGYSHFLFDSRDTKAEHRYDVFPEPELGGPGFGGRGFGGRRGFGGPYGYWSYRPSWGYSAFAPDVDIITTTRYEAYAEIVLLTDAQASGEVRAVDAHEVIAHLTPPPAPPPT